MLTLAKDVGPIVGLISFAFFCGLVVLYLVRAREIRRVRQAAPFLSKGNGRPKATKRRAAANRRSRRPTRVAR